MISIVCTLPFLVIYLDQVLKYNQDDTTENKKNLPKLMNTKDSNSISDLSKEILNPKDFITITVLQEIIFYLILFFTDFFLLFNLL